MAKLKLVFILALFFVTISSVLAVQPTQQFNKIFLNPFYRESMSQNTNYTYTLKLETPDGISEVKSAIIVFDIWITPSVSFNLWVNGKTCNNPTYLISTTYADAGRGVVTFDCSNVITKEGNYTFTLRPSLANTGSSTAWVEVTYMNNPQGNLEISGTEYSPNDPATMFVQLKDSQGLAVSNGACYLDVWYPANGSGVHPYTIQDAPMLKALGDDGIYYYDVFAPSQLGVYMLSAKCSYSFDWKWIYQEDDFVYYPTRTEITGTWEGSSSVLNSFQDDNYDKCSATAVIPCQATYSFNVSTYGSISNITTINLYWAGQSDIASKTITFAYYNGTTYVNLPNTITTLALGSTATVVGDTDQFATNSVPLNAIQNSIVTIRITTPTGLARYYNNWLSLAVLSSSGSIQDLKGSSEMHVTNISGSTLAGLNCSPSAVWSFSNRNLTYYPSVDLSGVPQQVWNYSGRNLTYYPPQVDMTNYTQVANYVWSYTGNVALPLLNQLVSGVWNYTFGRYTNGEIV